MADTEGNAYPDIGMLLYSDEGLIWRGGVAYNFNVAHLFHQNLGDTFIADDAVNGRIQIKFDAAKNYIASATSGFSNWKPLRIDANHLTLGIAGTDVLVFSATGAGAFAFETTVNGNLFSKANTYFGPGNTFLCYQSGADRLFQWDADDYDYYLSGPNLRGFVIGGTVKMTMTAAGISVPGIIATTGAGAQISINDRSSAVAWALYCDVGALRFHRLDLGTGVLVLDSSGHLYPSTDSGQALGLPSNRWTAVYAATGTIQTSDEREKLAVAPIPDVVLDAWGEVEWIEYKWAAQVEEKGEGARLNFGLIAQRIDEAFAAHGLSAASYGLFCYDEWPDLVEPIYIDEVRPVLDEQGQPKLGPDDEPLTETVKVDSGETRILTPAGNRYGVRYEECLALEAAWMRRELARLKAPA